MLIEDKYFKEYKRILKGIEGKGYSDWKETVKSEIEKEPNKENVKKRVEIKICQYEVPKKFHSLYECVVQLAAITLAFITLAWNYVGSVSDTINAFCKEMTSGQLLKITDLLGYTFKSGGFLIIAIIIFLLFSNIYDSFSERKRAMKLIYYKEIMNIIGETES